MTTADESAALDGVVALADEAATVRLGTALAAFLGAGDAVTLAGSLGVGKTTLARAVIRALGEKSAEIPSPTFPLVLIYELPDLTVQHIDLYRVEREEEILELGIDELFTTAVSLIEWPDRLGSFLPPDRLEITLEEVCGGLGGDSGSSHRPAHRLARFRGSRRWGGLRRLAGCVASG